MDFHSLRGSMYSMSRMVNMLHTYCLEMEVYGFLLLGLHISV